MMCDKLNYNSEDDYLRSFTNLFKIASSHDSSQKSIRYPKMNEKEFETIKNQKLSLKDFSPVR